MTQTNTTLLLLSEISHLLSQLYISPAENDTASMLSQLKELSQYTNDDFESVSEKLLKSFEPISSLELQVDHAALFVGPYQLLAHPYGSVYLENNKQLMGETTAALKKLYQSAGVDMSTNANEAPDHICIELEFLHFLLFNLSESPDDEQLNSTLIDFLKTYYLPFTTIFLDKIVQHAETDFYQTLGSIHSQYNNLLKDCLVIE